MMQLACSTLCFTQLSLADALARSAALGFRYVDLGVQAWAHVSAPELVSSGEHFAASLRADAANAGVAVCTMNVGLERDADQTLAEQTAAVSALAASLDLTAICINAPANDVTLADAVAELTPLADIAARHGVMLCLETHVNCLTETPPVAAQLAGAVPNLGLALDPSHFYGGPWQGKDISAAYPHTHIVHLRDATISPPALKVPAGTGDVDFAGMLRSLAEQGYAGPLAVEYIDSGFTAETYPNHVAQVAGMAALARSLLAELDVSYA